MTKTCVDCSIAFVAPERGHGRMVRCRPCRDTNRQRRQEAGRRSPAGRYGTAKAFARYRGIAWDIPQPDFEALIRQPCTYCGNPLNTSGAGLDRLIDGGPYSLANAVPCCWPCNYIKRRGAFTYDEMMRLGVVLGPIWQVHQPRGTKLQTGRSR